MWLQCDRKWVRRLGEPGNKLIKRIKTWEQFILLLFQKMILYGHLNKLNNCLKRQKPMEVILLQSQMNFQAYLQRNKSNVSSNTLEKKILLPFRRSHLLTKIRPDGLWRRITPGVADSVKYPESTAQNCPHHHDPPSGGSPSPKSEAAAEAIQRKE